ncbi:RNA polymerase sigma factor [Lewinella sp. W8]|uniref:RNA polymerase sigma factor n=1 Tax=Lewinella sp. W8 TaxID=2528208 RepID=UPI001068A7B7|nr:RNA polymerase sigma factor [Lewinella sp. W8]MTB50093.1 sigma-70 family RNA polymerase sigma factor [Lewinella sp. W8]
MDEKERIFLSVLDGHKGIIYKVANTYCNDASDRDDLIQEITLQIWRSIDNYREEYKWSTWIYRIALNTSISFYRKNSTRRARTVGLGQIIEVPNADDESPDDENFVLLRKFIRELREIDKALILLHLEGLSSQEIADIMATTQTNVTTKISRIRKKLKLKFQNHKK